jgi:hypothetical protein
MAKKDCNVSLSKAAGALALAMMLAACSSDGGSQVGRLARQGIQPEAPATAIPQAPAPTETPDFGDPQPVMTAQPLFIEVTRQVVDVQEVEATRIVVVTATPQPSPTCDPRTPAPTVALDATDIAAGVILRGVWPCYEVQP